MYHIQFPAQSTRASWEFIGQITDLDDNLIDISTCDLVFHIGTLDQWPMLTASTENGKLTNPSTGVFRWFFTRQEMSTLTPMQYNTGFTITNDDGTQTLQLSVGPLAIVDGVVPL